MAHLSLSQGFLIIVSKLAASLQPASPLSPPFSPPPQHLACLQSIIILALTQYNMWFLLIAINAVSSYVSVNTQYQYLQNLRANHVAY